MEEDYKLKEIDDSDVLLSTTGSKASHLLTSNLTELSSLNKIISQIRDFITEAKLLSQAEKYDEAITKYYDCLDLIPEGVYLQNHLEILSLEEELTLDLSFALVQAGYYDAARNECQEAIKRYPNSTSFKYNLGVALIALQDLNGALLLLKEVKRKDQNLSSQAQSKIDIINKIRDECNKEVKVELGVEDNEINEEKPTEAPTKALLPKYLAVGIALVGVISLGVFAYKKFKK